MDRIRAALLLDFDNIFGGLLDLERRAALILAENPARLLRGLSEVSTDGAYRDILVCRAYLNPNGWINDEALGNDSNRLYLQRFRPNLTRAGFQVVDCPVLTAGQKNAADIRMVIDTLRLLDHPTRFDEVIIASSDADFTPLLHELRAHDRRTTIITAGQIAPAYGAVADLYIDESALIGLLTGEPADDGDAPVATARPKPAGPESPAYDLDVIRDRAEEQIRTMMEAATEPVLFSTIGHELHRRLPTGAIRASNWFGSGGLKDFLLSLLPDLATDAYRIWDPARHQPPDGPDEAGVPELPALIEQLCQVAEMPRLAAGSWPHLFAALSEYAGSHEFHFTEANQWALDRLAGLDEPVGRQAITFVIRGVKQGGSPLTSDPPPTPADLAKAFRTSLQNRAEAQGMSLTGAEADLLAAWFDGIEPEPTPTPELTPTPTPAPLPDRPEPADDSVVPTRDDVADEHEPPIDHGAPVEEADPAGAEGPSPDA